MSFFTSNAYASFHQSPPSLNLNSSATDTHLPTASSSSSSSSSSPHKRKTSNGSKRSIGNDSFISTCSTNSLSDFDPLSPVNFTHGSTNNDPWTSSHFNQLHLPLPASGQESYPLSFASSSSAALASTSLKVFASDDHEGDEEWGEFVTFGSRKDSDCGSHINEEIGYSYSPTKEEADLHTGSGSPGHPAREREGYSRMANAHYAEEEEEDEQAQQNERRYHYSQPIAHQAMSRLPREDLRPTSPLASLASLFRLGSSSSLTGKANPSKPGSPQQQPPRNYDSYDVMFAKGPIGLELETDWYGRQAVVKGFKRIHNDSQDGPAKTCGLIRIGDVLTAINGESCLEMNFQDTLARLRQVSKGPHTLHFKSLETVGDLSVYNHDLDILQAKKFIHEHKQKFYRPPLPLTSADNKALIPGCVERLRGPSVTSFNFHREDTGEFLLACSCVNECTGVFLFHTLQDAHLREFKDLPQSEDSAVYLGQMVPNFLGTEFTLFDHQQKQKNELAFLIYSSNVLGRVPNFLKCVFPRQAHHHEENGDEKQPGTTKKPNALNSTFAPTGSIAERYKRLKQSRQFSFVERLRTFSLDDLEWSVDFITQDDGEKLAALWYDDDDHTGKSRASLRLRSNSLNNISNRRSMSSRNLSTPYGAVEQHDYACDLLTFETKKPAWNEELGAWTLNFQGRVKMASKKNFLVVAEQGNPHMETEFPEEATFLRFGKVAKTRFALDYQTPLSPMLALAIACSSFAHKIAVT